MALRSPVEFHNFWGTANPTSGSPWTSGTLPNEGAVPAYQSGDLQAGDYAYVAGVAPGTGTFYLCTDPGVGNINAVWVELTSGGSAVDRFSPKYMVGGPSDTAAALPGTSGFWFFPDNGNGAGIEAALAQAALFAGDVYIRPGVFTLTGVSTLPLVVPAGVRLCGSGASAGGTAIQYIVPASPSTGTAFRLLDGSELRDVLIEADDALSATGGGVVEVGAVGEPATAHCERVKVSLTRSELSTSNLRSAFVVTDGSKLTQDRCDVVLDGTGASSGPYVPAPIDPVSPPVPTGATWTVGTLGGENFPDLATALASGSVVNGDRLLLSSQTFTVAATITVAKQVTIQGAGLASTVLQTAATGADPVTVITVTASNVTIRDLTVKQRRTTNTSIETAISINPPGGGAGATGHYVEAVRVETMEFGIVIRSDGWQINNCQLAYVGPNNATRRLVATYRSNGQGLFCNTTFDSGQNGVITGNTRVFSILTTTGLPTELTGGYLRLGNITPSNAFPVQQFVNCEWFPANPSLLTFYVDSCVTNETSAFVVWANSNPSLLSRFASIAFANNTLSGNHGGAPIGTKGMFAVDSSGANAQPWGTTTFYASGNTIGNTTFITGWQTIMSTALPPGYGAAELALAGWDGTYFVGNPALEFATQNNPPDPANALTGWRTTGDLKLDVCTFEGGDAGVLGLPPAQPTGPIKVDIDQSKFSEFSLLGVGCYDCELAVTGATRIESTSVVNTEMFGIICRPISAESNVSTVMVNAQIKLPQPTLNPSTSTGVDIEVESGQVMGSRIEAASGIVSLNATGRGVAIGFNNIISQPGQQVSVQVVDEEAHNILST